MCRLLKWLWARLQNKGGVFPEGIMNVGKIKRISLGEKELKLRVGRRAPALVHLRERHFRAADSI